MKLQKYHFPEGLYADIRIEEGLQTQLMRFNGELVNDWVTPESGAMIRVYDGKLWYTAATSDLGMIQQELDNLAALATPNPAIGELPEVAKLEVNVDRRLQYEGPDKLENISRDRFMRVLEEYTDGCFGSEVSGVSAWTVRVGGKYLRKSFYSSKGSAIEYDSQMCGVGVWCTVGKEGAPTNGGLSFSGLTPEELPGHESEILAELDRYIEFAEKAVDVEPGEYTCVLSPITTAMFAHESFGHKSEADFMLHDQTLRDEWVMGKKVGSDLVTIVDSGDLPNHGYTPYDDEGTKARETVLIKNGVLTGRLHDASSAAVLGEELTGNCRAQSYGFRPMVRMTNTYFCGGSDSLDDIIADTKDGIYVYMVSNGTGNSTFVLNPMLCYRIRDGKICEPLRVHMVTGSVFRTLFEVDRVGSDYKLFDDFTCGKMGQMVDVSAGGPTIRVRSLQVN